MFSKAAVSGLIAASLFGATSAHAALVPPFDHIIVIMMENHSISEIVGNPDALFLNGLTADNPVATNYFGITHPSLPNYMAAIGGDTFFASNCSIAAGGCTTPDPSLADRIEASGRTWKAYMEDMPSPCFVGNDYPVVGGPPAYVEKHNPFIHFDNIRNDPARCDKIVPYWQLTADLEALPNFVWITPNMCNGMHDRCSPDVTEVKAGDNWLSVEVPRIQNSASCALPQTCLIIITFDEGNSGLQPPEDNHIFTIFVKSGPRSPDSNTLYDHYSFLSTIEDSWGLAPLTVNDAVATLLADMFWAPVPLSPSLSPIRPADGDKPRPHSRRSIP